MPETTGSSNKSSFQFTKYLSLPPLLSGHSDFALTFFLKKTTTSSDNETTKQQMTKSGEKKSVPDPPPGLPLVPENRPPAEALTRSIIYLHEIVHFVVYSPDTVH